jgi:GNAT superfamily N-acetyltransferase
VVSEWRRGEFTLTTDPARADVDAVHAFLLRSYWAEGIPREVVARSIAHSLCFTLLHGGRLIGFARVITDRATFAYLGDVFVLDAYRGRGLAAWMMDVVHAHPELQGFRRWVLLTRDAHALYRRVGYTALAAPERYLERWTPHAYATKTPGARSSPGDPSPAGP